MMKAIFSGSFFVNLAQVKVIWEEESQLKTASIRFPVDNF